MLCALSLQNDTRVQVILKARRAALGLWLDPSAQSQSQPPLPRHNPRTVNALAGLLGAFSFGNGTLGGGASLLVSLPLTTLGYDNVALALETQPSLILFTELKPSSIGFAQYFTSGGLATEFYLPAFFGWVQGSPTFGIVSISSSANPSRMSSLLFSLGGALP